MRPCTAAVALGRDADPDLFLTHAGFGGVREALDEADATALEVACRKVLDDSAYRLAARGYQRRILSLPGAGRLVADLTTLVD